MKKVLLCAAILPVVFLLHPLQAQVKIREEPLVLPSYAIGPADPNPMFYENESYQGAQRPLN
jgi:hypothetical protein